MKNLTIREFLILSKLAEGPFSCILKGRVKTCTAIAYKGDEIAAWLVHNTRTVIRRRTNMTNEPTRIQLENEEAIGPQIDISFPQSVEVKFSGKTLWINIDEVCRLRVSRVNQAIIKWDVPGFTQREVEG